MSDITPASIQARATPIDALEVEKKLDADLHLETLGDVEGNKRYVELTSTDGAIAAELAEQSMTFREAFRDYRSAVLWSLGISLCIIMEGYDTALPVGSTCAAPFSRLIAGKLCRSTRIPREIWRIRQRGGRLSADSCLAGWTRPMLGYRFDPVDLRNGVVPATIWLSKGHSNRTLCHVLLHLHRVLCAEHRESVSLGVIDLKIMLAIGYHLCGWAW
jgi:hypothetical protein